MIARWLLPLMLSCAVPVQAQQAVRVPVGGVQLTAQLYRPAAPGRVPAVAIFHGCGGVGVNNTRMAGLLKEWGYAALVVDSFGARHMVDVCGRHWPTEAEAQARERDIDAALAWLAKQEFVDSGRLAFIGYSYGGGVALLRALSAVEKAKGKLKGDEKYGADIVAKAIEHPCRTIADNAGYDGSVVVEAVKEAKGTNGFNAKTGNYEDLAKSGVLDPAKVVKSALQNAASVAALLLTVDTMITEVKEKGEGKDLVAGAVH